MCGLGKSWLIQYVKQRIRHIEVYVETTAWRACAVSFCRDEAEEENQEKTGWLMTVSL
jgi:hypothetical protein